MHTLLDTTRRGSLSVPRAVRSLPPTPRYRVMFWFTLIRNHLNVSCAARSSERGRTSGTTWTHIPAGSLTNAASASSPSRSAAPSSRTCGLTPAKRRITVIFVAGRVATRATTAGIWINTSSVTNVMSVDNTSPPQTTSRTTCYGMENASLNVRRAGKGLSVNYISRIISDYIPVSGRIHATCAKNVSAPRMDCLTIAPFIWGEWKDWKPKE